MIRQKLKTEPIRVGKGLTLPPPASGREVGGGVEVGQVVAR